MSAGTSASFCLIVCFLFCSSEALENIPAVVGENVTLRCEVTNNQPIIVVEWSRPGLGLEYVFLYRDGHFDSDNQHPSYQNRVDLKDREMRDGDVSMVLKNVTMEDRGRYECHVVQREPNSRKRRWTDPTSIIYLVVYPAGTKDGGKKDGGDKVVIIAVPLVAVVVLFVVASVGVLVYTRRMRQIPTHLVPPDDPADVQMLKQSLSQQQQNKVSPGLHQPCGPSFNCPLTVGGGFVSSEDAGSSAVMESSSWSGLHDRLDQTRSQTRSRF